MVTSGWRKDPLSKKPYDLLTEAAVILTAVCRLLMNARLRTENECRDSMYMGGGGCFLGECGAIALFGLLRYFTRPSVL